MREKLARLRAIIWNQKYRFQLAQQWLVFVNFGLLIVTLAKVMGLRAAPVLLVAVPAGFLGMWLWGWFLDVVVRQGQTDEKEALKRSPAWSETHRKVGEIHARIFRGDDD